MVLLKLTDADDGMFTLVSILIASQYTMNAVLCYLHLSTWNPIVYTLLTSFMLHSVIQSHLRYVFINPVIIIFPGAWKDILPMKNIFSPVSG